MNKIQTFGNPAKERTALALANTVNAVRKPYPPECRECKGSGERRVYFTNNPSEKLTPVGCEYCNGTGYQPGDGCGPWCGCWKDATLSFSYPNFGYCDKDDAETAGPILMGDQAYWRRKEDE